MKTKEIDVYIELEQANAIINNKQERGFKCWLTSDFLSRAKAKLIIEMPERKIEISESELSRILNSCEVSHHKKSLILERVFILKDFV